MDSHSLLVSKSVSVPVLVHQLGLLPLQLLPELARKLSLALWESVFVPLFMLYTPAELVVLQC